MLGTSTQATISCLSTIVQYVYVKTNVALAINQSTPHHSQWFLKTFPDAPPLWNKYFIFIMVNANCLLNWVAGIYLVKIILFLIAHGNRPLFRIG